MKRILHKVSQVFRPSQSDSPGSDAQDQDTQGIPNNKQSRNTLIPSMSHLTSPSTDFPRNILAFRTITTLLSAIRPERELSSPAKAAKPSESRDRQQLRLSNAFATMAVIEHEVVAVVTNITSEKLQLIACIETKRPIHKENPSSESIWQFLFAQNPRKPSPPLDNEQTGDPTITDARILSGLTLGNDEEIKEYVEQRWSHSKMAGHLWILGKLLTMKDDKKDFGIVFGRLLPYVVATCYMKIKRRLKNDLSKPYMKALRAVKTVLFDESQRGTPRADELANDRQFLVNYLLTTAERRGTETPNLIKQAELARDHKPFHLYTEDTCMEFHNLFIDLLEEFGKALDAMGKEVKAQGKNSSNPAKGSEKFKQQVNIVVLCGYALQRLSKSAALKMHLKLIGPLLKTNLGIFPPQMTEEEEELDEDPDLEALQPLLRIETSYIDWLRLVLVHFDAVEILVNFVTEETFVYKDISIEIVVAPPVGECLLPWKELLMDSTLFPGPRSSTQASTSTTNDQILEFLGNAVETFAKGTATLAKIQSTKKLWGQGKFQDARTNLGQLKAPKWPGWDESVHKTLEKMLNDHEPDATMARAISNEIQVLCDSAKFYTCLSEGRRFSGTLHCEAYLASLLVEPATVSKGISEQMKDFGSLIGISKCCCPVCRHLLHLLPTDKEFIVRGFHNTVTACTLPTWLPGPIVDSMNQHFGNQLRQELVVLMKRTGFSRNRAQSTGSERLSSDTAAPSHDNQLPLDYFTDGAYGVQKQ